MSIVFLIPYIPIPRMIKRINTAYTIDTTSVIFWDRGTDIIENLTLPRNVVAHRILVSANEGNPFKRIGATIKFCTKAYKKLKSENPKCIHVTKTDMLILVWLYCITKRNKPYVIYEVSDIHKLALNRSNSIIKILIKKILYLLEYIGFKVVDKLIVTSESFWTVYYKKMISKEDMIFLPNTPREEVFETYKPKSTGKFCIGFIGKVRYKKQIKMLIDVSKDIDIDVLIAGNGIDLDEIIEYSRNFNNVSIFGSYSYEQEISDLYGRIDCVFSMYDSNIQNVQIALPNRLYEAALCGLPLIVSEGTELANIVESEGLGLVVKDNDIDGLISALNKLKDESYRKNISEHCKDYYEKWRYNVVNVKLSDLYNEIF